MGLLDIGQALAAVDQFKKRVGLLASDPAQFAAGTSGPELGASPPYPGGLLSVMPQVREQAITEALKLTPGLLGATSPLEYRGLHTAPMSDSGAPGHDVTGGGKVYPDDVYSANQVRYYGTGEPIDYQTFSLVNQMRGKPDAKVRIYRAIPLEEAGTQAQIDALHRQMYDFMRRGTVPEGEAAKGWYDRAVQRMQELQAAPPADAAAINPGDWVTINRNYAKQHGESTLEGQYKIVSKVVKARDIFTNGDSIHEWGYDPK